MYLSKLQIRNFRNIKSGIFDFNKGTNTIVGENDSGKSNAMIALRILLDNNFFYNNKRLIEKDFSENLPNWKGHWIMISACFNDITSEDITNEICKNMVPSSENEKFLKSIIRCRENNYGTVTLFIRPNKNTRSKLFENSNKTEFEEVRNSITLDDYEFYYTTKSQELFTNNETYKNIIGDLENQQYNNPEEDDDNMLGVKVDILEVWQYISIVFIDALRDVEMELNKLKNPVRRIVDTIQSEIEDYNKKDVINKIEILNKTLSEIPQIANIGKDINSKLEETIGMLYAPNIKLESQMKNDITYLSKFLTISPSNSKDLNYLGLGHLNVIYISLKLVEFKYNRSREILNIMIIEEPEAHVHTHIQKTLFDNIDTSKKYTQIIMTTHSTHIAEVAQISSMNVLKTENNKTIIMQPANKLEEFAREHFKTKDIPFVKVLERYLDSKRSVLLFSKSVILVEGDGEEILIPNLIKIVFGISLDELGIGVINIGSIAFENIASIFNENRIQKKCAIITDLDEMIPKAKKCKKKAENLGKVRYDKLHKIFKNCKYVSCFFAKNTLEYEFVKYEKNINYVNNIIDLHYVQKNAKLKHKSNLKNEEHEKYDSVLTIANTIKKGWYATILSSVINYEVIIPDYILDAFVFVSKDMISLDIKIKIIKYFLNKVNDNDLLNDLINIETNDEKENLVNKVIVKYPSEIISIFLVKCGNNE